MKVQIRQGVFETNSSSMHALALQKDFKLNCDMCKEKYKDIIPEHITLKVDTLESSYYDISYYDEESKHYKDYDEKGIVANKIKLVYCNIIGRLTEEYGYINLTQFFGWLTKLGITYDIPYQPDVFYVNDPMEKRDAYFCDYCDSELFNQIFDGTEESFCNFLFGDGSQLDGFETDCCSEKEEDKFWKKLENGGRCKIFSHYGG